MLSKQNMHAKRPCRESYKIQICVGQITTGTITKVDDKVVAKKPNKRVEITEIEGRKNGLRVWHMKEG